MDSIRIASVEDARSCSLVLCASIRELCVADHQNDEQVISRWLANKTPANLERWIHDPKSVLYVAQRDGEISGVGGIHKEGEVTLNYVFPLYRASGVSRSMLAQMEAALKELGVSEAKLTSTETAHLFYQAAGWRTVGQSQNWLGLPGYQMSKLLGGSPI